MELFVYGNDRYSEETGLTSLDIEARVIFPIGQFNFIVDNSYFSLEEMESDYTSVSDIYVWTRNKSDSVNFLELYHVNQRYPDYYLRPYGHVIKIQSSDYVRGYSYRSSDGLYYTLRSTGDGETHTIYKADSSQKVYTSIGNLPTALNKPRGLVIVGNQFWVYNLGDRRLWSGQITDPSNSSVSSANGVVLSEKLKFLKFDGTKIYGFATDGKFWSKTTSEINQSTSFSTGQLSSYNSSNELDIVCFTNKGESYYPHSPRKNYIKFLEIGKSVNLDLNDTLGAPDYGKQYAFTVENVEGELPDGLYYVKDSSDSEISDRNFSVEGAPSKIGNFDLKLSIVNRRGKKYIVTLTFVVKESLLSFERLRFKDSGINIHSSYTNSNTTEVNISKPLGSILDIGLPVGKGGSPPYRYNVVDGYLPENLSVIGNRLKGFILEHGTFDFVWSITDKRGDTSLTQISLHQALDENIKGQFYHVNQSGCLSLTSGIFEELNLGTYTLTTGIPSNNEYYVTYSSVNDVRAVVLVLKSESEILKDVQLWMKFVYNETYNILDIVYESDILSVFLDMERFDNPPQELEVIFKNRLDTSLIELENKFKSTSFPEVKASDANKLIVVNSDGTGYSLLDISGQSGKSIRVNSAGTGLEFFDSAEKTHTHS